MDHQAGTPSPSPVAKTAHDGPDGAGAEPGGETEVARLRREVADLRGRLLAHPGISLAQGILMERYAPATPEDAFSLLRDASQRFNIKMHTLADAVARMPGPDPDAAVWFPGRARGGPPALRGLPVDPAGRDNQGAVLNAVLRRVLAVTGAGMGNVQLAEHGRLRLVKHVGLGQEFTDFFAFVDDSSTACGKAAESGRQVTVRDIATAALFDDASRRTILRAGSRACHSVPLVDRSGTVLGMVSSHHERPLAGFTQAQLRTLEEIGGTAGHWLAWHRRTVVLDALEHLHGTARGRRGAP
ncbi:GAF domain-containing protein [Streptomyces sp. NPDC006134]|uniref:GAF and ANTAR domain-containing protein n=1 Tax=Streptomyces sp. NPDC006134 TaxID=3154467 RepID=UPI0033D85984